MNRVTWPDRRESRCRAECRQPRLCVAGNHDAQQAINRFSSRLALSSTIASCFWGGASHNENRTAAADPTFNRSTRREMHLSEATMSLNRETSGAHTHNSPTFSRQRLCVTHDDPCTHYIERNKTFFFLDAHHPLLILMKEPGLEKLFSPSPSQDRFLLIDLAFFGVQSDIIHLVGPFPFRVRRRRAPGLST